MVEWIGYTIFIPLIPIGINFAIFVLTRTEFSYFEIFDGLELMLLALVVSSLTKNDLDNAKIDIKKHSVYRIISRLVLPLLILFSMMFTTLIYVEENWSDLGLVDELVVRAGLIQASVVTIVCIPTQYAIMRINSDAIRIMIGDR